MPGQQRRRLDHLGRQLGRLGLEKFIIVEVTVTGPAINPVQFEFNGKRVARQNPFHLGRPHFLHMLHSHVLAHTDHHLLAELVGEPQPPQDHRRHLRAHPVVLVKPDPVRRALKRGRFANVMQQDCPSQHRVGLRRERVQHHHHMREHIAFGMELRRLFDALERRHFRQYFAEQTGLLQ